MKFQVFSLEYSIVRTAALHFTFPAETLRQEKILVISVGVIESGALKNVAPPTISVWLYWKNWFLKIFVRLFDLLQIRKMNLLN